MKGVTAEMKNIASKNRELQLQRMKRAIRGELTPRQQEIVRMVFYEHLRQAEVARRLGLSRSTVCRTLHRAESRLRKRLEY